jgi:hypothetical protein
MPLNNATADAVAASICSALGVTDTASQAKYKQVYEILYAALKTDISIAVTVTSVSGVTSGPSVSGPGAGTGVPL